MNTKMSKYLKYAAAAVFVATLAINTVVTLDDPFVLLSDAMADETCTNTISISSTGGFITTWVCNRKTSFWDSVLKRYCFTEATTVCSFGNVSP